MASTTLHTSPTPTTSTASSSEALRQKTQASSRILQALCVFEHLSNPEVLKSVQLYSENGSLSAIQQELTFSPNGYAQISEPIPSYFRKYNAIDSEDFFNALKKINEKDLWKCIFEYHTHRVPATIPQLLSVSSNPLLQSLPCLAYDLMLVEKDIQSRACDINQVVVPPSRLLELDSPHHGRCHYGSLQSPRSLPSPQETSLQSPTKWSISAMSALTGQSGNTEEDAEREALLIRGDHDALGQHEDEPGHIAGQHEMEMHQAETNLHEWGSDLELASPRMFHPCQLGSSWSTSTMTFAGGLSGVSPTALSPTSSMVTNQKGGGIGPHCSSWNSPLFISSGSLPAVDGFPVDPSSSLSTHSSLAHLKPLSTASDFSNSLTPLSPGSLLESSVNSLLGPKQVRQLNSAGHLRRVYERSPSHCSDDSVGTPLNPKRIAQAEALASVGLSLQPLGTSLAGDKETGLMYRDLAGYSIEGAAGCPTPRSFSGLQLEAFPACANESFLKNGRYSGGQPVEDFSASRLEVFPTAQVENYGGCQNESFSGFQNDTIYAPRADTFPPGGHADIFWNENFLRDCRNEGLHGVGYLQDGQVGNGGSLLRDPPRNQGGLLSRNGRSDAISLDFARGPEVNYLNRTSDIAAVGNISTKNMLEKVTGNAQGHHQRGPSERMTEITLAELSHYFNMPITQASKELKVGLTVLKKRCREFGIPRWPHRKMKSLDSLIHNIQELAKGSAGQTSGQVLNAVRELESQKKRMEERPGIELAEKTKRLRQACFKASYKKRRQAQVEAGLSQSSQSRQSKDGSPSVRFDQLPMPSGGHTECVSATMVS